MSLQYHGLIRKISPIDRSNIPGTTAYMFALEKKENKNITMMLG